MKRYFYHLSIGLYFLFVIHSLSADNAFREFQKNEQKEFQEWKTGKKAQSNNKPSVSKITKETSSQSSYSGYKTYVLPPVIKSPEEQKAWDLYKGYLETNKKIAEMEKEIKKIENIGADSATMRTWRWLASAAEIERHDKLVAELPNVQKELANIIAEWEKTYAGYYGQLSDSGKTISVNYLDPNDKSWPQKIQTIEMDRIEFRLRSFPFSQRGSGQTSVASETTPPVITVPEEKNTPSAGNEGEKKEDETTTEIAGTDTKNDEKQPPPSDNETVKTDTKSKDQKTNKPDKDESGKEESATVAPSLIRTDWKGKIVISSEQMLNEKDEMEEFLFDPPIKGETNLKIDNANKATGSFEIPDCARQLHMGDTDKPIVGKLDGVYNSKAGTISISVDGRLDLPNNDANIADVPMANYIKLQGKLEGKADSDSDLFGDMRLEALHILEPSRPVTADDIEKYVWKECPEKIEEFGEGKDKQQFDVNAGARKALKEAILKTLKERMENTVIDKAIINGAWRMIR